MTTEIPSGMYETRAIEPVKPRKENDDRELLSIISNLENRIAKLEAQHRRQHERNSGFSRFIGSAEQNFRKIFSDLDNKISRSD